MYALNKIVILLIKFYQKTLSFDHSFLKIFYPNGFCRFYPTCSEYAIGCFRKYGFLKATLKTLKRVLKCNHKTKPKIDLP